MEQNQEKPKNNKKQLWIITIIVFVILSFILTAFAYYLLSNFYPDIFGKKIKTPEVFKLIQKKKESSNSCPDCLRRNIDGIYVRPGQENLQPAAVIIENHPDSRPSSGLAQASLVFEAEAEGGITRYLAIFASGDKLDKIGPIRSARPYFTDWARELSSLFVHVGGSPEALVKIIQENVFDLNEFYQGGYFWRDNNKLAPHNVYISSENINKYLEEKGASGGKFFSWKFKDDLELEKRPEQSKIKINFQTSNYIVEWVYDKENNNYLRFLAGQRHKDANGDEIRAKNIAIARVEAKIIDEEFRLKMSHIGSGDSIVCLDGRCEEGNWEKKNKSTRLRFYNDNDEEIEFNAGAAWIEIVRPEREIIY